MGHHGHVLRIVTWQVQYHVKVVKRREARNMEVESRGIRPLAQLSASVLRANGGVLCRRMAVCYMPLGITGSGDGKLMDQWLN